MRQLQARQFVWSFLIAGAISFLPHTLAARENKTKFAEWLYIVKSKSTDSTRENEYNDWYTNIDIPDVLEVPGFNRARRAVASQRLSTPPAAFAVDGDFIAVYDIKSTNIDRTIIDLYVGARRMTWRGRTTDLLKVTEANYYTLVWDKSLENNTSKSASHVFLAKINCCNQEPDRKAMGKRLKVFAESASKDNPQISRVSLYHLYRVMETEALPENEQPHLMMLIESHGSGIARSWLASIDKRTNEEIGRQISEDSREYSVFNVQHSRQK